MDIRLTLAPSLPLAIALLFHLGCGSKATSSSTTGGETTTATTGAGTGGGSGGTGGSATTTTGSGGSGGAACPEDPKLPEEELPDLSDPAKGMFTMDEALAGLPDGPGPLRAIFDTDLGKVVCELRPDKTPTGVANFVGLARGLRPWKDPATKKWVKRRFYDGLLFHRVIPGFMAQGGDPLGTGYGGPGYSFVGEISDLSHVPGTLAYANPGSNSNGSQFYITETKQTGLDGSYVIFGLCNDAESLATVKKLTHVPTTGQNGNPADRPLMDLHLKAVTITRCAP